MKLKTYLPLILLLAFIAFAACDNEPLEGEFVVDDGIEMGDDTTDPTDDTGDGTDPDPTAKLVSQEFSAADRFNDYTYAEGLLVNWVAQFPGGTGNIDFVYDASNRVINYSFTSPGFEQTYDLTYNADGSLATYDDVVLSYDGDVVTAMGTLEGTANAVATMLTNGSGLVTRMTTQDGDYSEYTYDSNGNMTSAIGYTVDGTVTMSFTMTYDANVNPFYGQVTSLYYERFIEWFFPFDGVFIGSYEGYSFPYSKNNLTSIVQETGSDVFYTYTYDIEDYPIAVSEDIEGDLFEWTISY